MNPLSGELALPGWDASYTRESLRQVFAAYEDRTEEDLWHSLQYFSQAVVPAAKKAGVHMAIHQDAPPGPFLVCPAL